MNNNDAEIRNYYSYKDKSYKQKYQNGYFTHLHVGVYEPSVYAFLFDKLDNIEKLDLDRIQYLLFRGQENLSILVNNEININQSHTVLDCGCGYCGTSIFISQNNNIKHIDAISLSEKQISVTKELLKDINIDKISAKVSNIIDFNSDKYFDAIFSIEAVCHIESFDKLFNKFNSILCPNGKVIISDYFLYKNANAKQRIDEYWKTNISDIEYLILAAKQNGFAIEKILNLTHKQIPFWLLSQRYSKIILEVTEDNTEKDRLIKSIEQHKFLYNSFSNKDIQYYFIVLSKI